MQQRFEGVGGIEPGAVRKQHHEVPPGVGEAGDPRRRAAGEIGAFGNEQDIDRRPGVGQTGEGHRRCEPVEGEPADFLPHRLECAWRLDPQRGQGRLADGGSVKAHERHDAEDSRDAASPAGHSVTPRGPPGRGSRLIPHALRARSRITSHFWPPIHPV